LSSQKRRPRGEARRRAILDAVLTIVGRDGAGSVTHRAVAKEAGVPLAATTYYFASRDELLAEAFHTAAAEDIAQLRRDAHELAAQPVDASSLAARLCRIVDQWLAGDRLTLLAQYEISLEAARRPELAAASRAWTDAHVTALAPALRELGAAEPERDAWIVYSTLCGMVLDELAAPRPHFHSELLRPSIERLLGGLIAP
jgi:DNA-binding transcriptional regulator YbjK